MSTSIRLAGRVCWLPLLMAVVLGAAPAPSSEEAPDEAPPAGRDTLPVDAFVKILGNEVKNANDLVVGQIVNILVDPAGKPVGAVLDYGGFLGVGKRRLAVSWSVLSFTKNGILLGLSRDQLKNFPDYRDGKDAVMATTPAPPG